MRRAASSEAAVEPRGSRWDRAARRLSCLLAVGALAGCMSMDPPERFGSRWVPLGECSHPDNAFLCDVARGKGGG